MTQKLSYHDLRWGRSMQRVSIVGREKVTVTMSAPGYDPFPIVVKTQRQPLTGGPATTERLERYSRAQLALARKRYHDMVYSEIVKPLKAMREGRG